MGSVLSVPTLQPHAHRHASLTFWHVLCSPSAPALVPCQSPLSLSLSLSDSPAYGNLYCYRMRHAACPPPRTTAPPGEIIAVWTHASASAQHRAPARRRSEAEGARSGTGKNWRHGPSRVVDQGSLPRSLALAGGPHHAPYKKQQLLVVPWWASDRSLADGSRRHCQVDRSIRR